MAWADRASLILGIFWALFVFVMTGGTQRPDLGLFEHLWIFFLCWIIPMAIVWIVLRLILGNRGAVERPSTISRGPVTITVPEPRPWSLAELVEQNKARRRGETWKPQDPRPPRRAAG